MLSALSIFILILGSTVSHAADFSVTVGNNGQLRYDPQTVVANQGDTVTFTFHQKNHTVTQSTFQSPCVPLPGIDSGFNPVAPTVVDGFPTFAVTVNDSTTPVWFHCKQTSHCQQGMVFAINPPTSGDTFENFQAAAIASGSATATTSAWTSPPPPVIGTATATVTVAGPSSGSESVYTTTYASWEGSTPNPTPAAVPAVHTVQVGAGDILGYTPQNISAQINDIIQFIFYDLHTVTQATFDTPCVPLNVSSNGAKNGFDSGFITVGTNPTALPTFNITVNDTDPIWAYCAVPAIPTHCQAGMVFSINAPTTGANTFEAFQQLAKHPNGSTTTSTGGSSSLGSSSSSTPSPSSGSGSGSGSGSQGSDARHVVASAGLSTALMVVVVVILL
ncbi:hypothetical protein BU17DRAFT_77499 [Hysterangium stoloniferum]|nr:hypothetical protein BU17DRAFT_77499 [Hysterangium stoloniferum]